MITHAASRKHYYTVLLDRSRMGGVFILAEDEGFEPPQTESESGVLPLHKSSMYRTVILYPIFPKSQAHK